MRFVIVTGLSGAGKTEATKSLEDMGYFCVDNLPPRLIPKFAEACNSGNIEKVALVIDITLPCNHRRKVALTSLIRSAAD